MQEFGIVSNCWRAQLEEGVPLDELLAEADALGYRRVELRQGCLGTYETPGDGGPCPDAVALRALPVRFPRLRFNLALALPYLGGSVTPETPLYQAGLRGAVAVGRPGIAHLRLVDPETAPEALTSACESEIAARLTALATACAAQGAILSVENARQPWAAFRRIFDRARGQLGTDAGALGLCYDPCNLLGAADRPDPQGVTARLCADDVALFHFKQSDAGALLPVVGPGEVDWPGQLAALRAIGYTGPQLFEIPPGPEIWERLEQSRRYLDSIP
jgi:sugar phosphate isomerase/epimerase